MQLSGLSQHIDIEGFWWVVAVWMGDNSHTNDRIKRIQYVGLHLFWLNNQHSTLRFYGILCVVQYAEMFWPGLRKYFECRVHRLEISKITNLLYIWNNSWPNLLYIWNYSWPNSVLCISKTPSLTSWNVNIYKECLTWFQFIIQNCPYCQFCHYDICGVIIYQ